MNGSIRFFFCVICLIGLASCSFKWFHANEKFPKAELFFTMPFETIRAAITPEVDSIPETLPDFNAGEMVFFYLTKDGEQKMMFPESEYLMHLFQPAQIYQVNGIKNRKGISSEISEKFISKTMLCGNYPVFKSSIPILSAKRHGSMASDEKVRALQSADGVGGIISQRADNQQIMVCDAGGIKSSISKRSEKHIYHSANMESKKYLREENAVFDRGEMGTHIASLGTEHSESAGGSQTTEGEKCLQNKELSGSDFIQTQGVELSETAVENKQATVSDQSMLPPGSRVISDNPDPILSDIKHLDNAVYDFARLYFLTENTTDINQLFNSGMLNSIFENSLHESLLETLLVDAEYDSSHISGIFDSDLNQILCEELYIPTTEEIAAFQALLKGDIHIADLLKRKFSESFRIKALNTGCNYQMESDFNSIPGILHHGHPAALSISVTNTGDTPIYDLVIITAVPEHTKFVEFGEKSPARHGFINFYIASLDLIVTKIYRPLSPFERFQNVVILKIDPWEIN